MTTSGLSSDGNSLIATDASCYNSSNNENHNSLSSVDSSGYNSSQSRKGHYEESRENNVKSGQSEMKSFINVDDGSNLTDISPMLSCIRTLSECDAIWNEDRSNFFKSLSLKQLKNENDLKEDGFYFALSLHDGSCLFTSSAITHHLGFPKDMLNGQSFMNFVFSKDHITFANYLTQGLNACFIQNKREESHLGVNSFFCRLRVYQGLKFGYSVSDKKIQYKPFKITLHINELVDDMCVEKTSATFCVKATATAVSPAYTIPEEIPAMTSFSTRHTASCHFSHVDFSAIPYLGYLLQDMIGISVFNFYHNDDLSQLKDIYELVVKEHGSSFRSKPYRFKVQNGCYIMLETEWSCFINPWSHKMEFVVGQHRVLKGPPDINIFNASESEENITSEEILKECLKVQKEIKTILSQPLKNFGVNKSKRFCNKRKRDLASFVYNCVDEGYVGNKPKGNTDKQDIIEDRSNSDPDSVVMGDISPYRDVNDSSLSSETPPTVQQLRYQENIERFFASQPKTYSDGSDESNKNEKFSSGEDYQGSSSGSGNVSGNTSKDPNPSKKYENKIQESSSNSSKCNMSSFTTGDSGFDKSLEKDSPTNHSVSHVGSCAQMWKNSNDSVKNNVENFPSCLTLTEEALFTHNRINHKHLKQHQRKNKSSMGLSNVAAIKENTWFHPKDLIHNKHKKHSHNLTVSTPTQTDVHVTSAAHYPLPYQPTAVPTTAASPNTTSTPLPQVSYSCVLPPNNYSGSVPAPFFIPVVYMGNVPYYPPISTVHPQTGVPFWPTPIPAPAPAREIPTPNFPFPTINPCSHYASMIPSSGMTYSAFPFPGFNPFSSISYGVQSSGVTATSPLTTTTTTVASGTTHTFQNSISNRLDVSEQQVIPFSRVKERKQEVKSAVNECDMQVDDTRSSSFTQSSSFQSADKDEEMDFEIKKYHLRPPRSDKVELSSEIAYCYKMHIPSMEEVLKKDMDKLKFMQQPDLVNIQLQILQNENKVQSADDFYMTEPVLLGLATEDDVTEELEYREECVLRLMCEDS